MLNFTIFDINMVAIKIVILKRGNNNFMSDINIQTLIKGELIKLGGTGRMFLCTNEQGKYIFKPSEDRENQQRIDTKAYIQEVAYRIQKMIDPTTAVPCEVATIDGMFGTVQEFVEVDKKATNTFRENVISGEGLEQSQIQDILREYITDYLICNYDTHERNFIVDNEGRVRGIDKEQGYRFFEEENASSPLFTTNYNARYGEQGSIYSLIFERMRNGEIPKENLAIIEQYAKCINDIPDEEYIAIFQEYINAFDGDRSKLTADILARKARVVGLSTELNNSLDEEPPKLTKDDYQLLQDICNNDSYLTSGLMNYIPNLNSIIESMDETENETQIKYRIFEELASRIDKKDFSIIKNMKGNKYLVHAILEHKEEFNIEPDEITELIQSTHSIEFVDKCLENSNLVQNDEMRKKLMTVKERFLTRTAYSRAEDGTIQESGTIQYTEKELEAIRLYVGEAVDSKFYTGDDKAYTVINGLMKPGNVFSEIGPPNQREVLCSAIDNPQEFLKICENLYSAMHKYGKTIKEPIHAVRAEQAVDDLLKAGKTRSFFSMTIGEDALKDFAKENTSILEADIKGNVDCINVADVLQGDYTMANENELLVAPYTSFESEVLDEQQVEIELYDGTMTVGKKRCQLEFSEDAKSQELSQEEKEDYQKYLSIFMDENLRSVAKNYITNWHGQSSAEGYKEYTIWREAFQKVFGYRQREISIEIDKALTDQEITLQQIGKGTMRSFMQNPEKAMEAMETLEQGVRAQEVEREGKT